MCGIAGIFDLTDRREPQELLLRRMTDSLVHRGPDESGLFRQPGIGLGHRRLSIIDLSSGQQPMVNDDRSCTLVYNGEIYNYQELRDELVACGKVFRTQSDTEVLLRGWEQWGEGVMNRLRGMFAFAIWDRARDSVFLARDRLGIKPLYYAHLASGLLIFGSELKALTIHPELRREIDPYAIDEYFAYGYIPEPRTIFKQARKLEPGHTAMVRHGDKDIQPRQYWDVKFRTQVGRNVDELCLELTQRISDAVKVRLVSEVPIGAFLSGGVDSSAIVATMSKLQEDPVNTCSIGFDTAAFDESNYARAVAKQYGTKHLERIVDPNDFDLVDRLIDLYDEPFADSSAIPTYRVSELARRQVTVALSGDGGDEILAGYRRQRLHMVEEQVRRRIPIGIRKPLFGLLGTVYPKADWAPRVFRAKTTFKALAIDSVTAYFNTVSICNDAFRNRLFSKSFTSELQGYSAVEVMRRHSQSGPDHPLSQIQYLDIKTYLPGDILTKVDRASMAHSLEVRVPLLDHLLVDWLGGIPPEMKLNGSEGKYLLKRAMEPLLPKSILYRPKMGFSVPLAQWFRGPLKQRLADTVNGERLMDTGYFDRDYLRNLVDSHQSGRRDNSAPLWMLFMFDAFLKKNFE
ncbi:MAG: asparagine synthase (glutamine-hydrolyzing) [Gammaproteobacteria bacterium]|jgi:asparagine synthase (glutamine-hydrolysing)